MPLAESVLEEILFSHPSEFFPQRDFQRYARQLSLGPRSASSRIDIAFRDVPSGEIHLFEVKAAGKVTRDVVDQVERYVREATALQSSSCECPFPSRPLAAVVAPSIPRDVKELLADKDIAWFEFPEAQFERVARKNGISLVKANPPGLRLRYWVSLDAFLRSKRSSLPALRPKDENHTNVVSLSGLQLTLRCSIEHNCLDVDLTVGARGAHLFPRLCTQRAEIDAELGQEALWFKQGSERHVRVQRWGDVRDDAAWPMYHEWMRRTAEVLLRRGRSTVRGY